MGNDEDREIRECNSSAEAQKRADYLKTMAEASGKADSDDLTMGISFHNAILYKSAAKWEARAEELRKQETMRLAGICLAPLFKKYFNK